MTSARKAADRLVADLQTLANQNVPSLRLVRLAYSRAWRHEPAELVLDVARILVDRRCHAWIGYELIRFHRGAFASLDDTQVESLSDGLDSWDKVDAFGRSLTGPAWARGLISDGLADGWSRSPDRWLRRLALVSTIELADTLRMLNLCERLVGDRDDMVEKALSWTLRERSKGDPDAVRDFIDRNSARLGARVTREVGNKLRTGLKNPTKRG